MATITEVDDFKNFLRGIWNARRENTSWSYYQYLFYQENEDTTVDRFLLLSSPFNFIQDAFPFSSAQDPDFWKDVDHRWQKKLKYEGYIEIPRLSSKLKQMKYDRLEKHYNGLLMGIKKWQEHARNTPNDSELGGQMRIFLREIEEDVDELLKTRETQETQKEV